MDKKLPLKGKVYSDYRKDEEKLNGAKRRARMKAAIDAMKARKAAGIDISKPFKSSKYNMHSHISSAN